MTIMNVALNKSVNIIAIITIGVDIIYVIMMSIIKNKYSNRLTPKTKR